MITRIYAAQPRKLGYGPVSTSPAASKGNGAGKYGLDFRPGPGGLNCLIADYGLKPTL